MADSLPLPARVRALGEFLFETGVPSKWGTRVNAETDARALLVECSRSLETMAAQLRWLSKFAESRAVRQLAARALQDAHMETGP
jgi:hypothetical protein